MPAKSPRSARKTVVCTSRSRPVPAASRIARRFWKICSVCSSIEPAISLSSGFRPSWPETNTNSPARIACEYGAPWNGAGALSVRTTDLASTAILLLSPAGPGALRQCHAEALEDRLQHVLRVSPLDQADVERQACALRELSQKPGDEVGREAADAHVGQIDVRDEQRPPRCFQGDVGERLVGRDDGGAVPARALGVQGSRERLAERPAGGRDLGIGLLRRHLEREVERRVLGQERQKMVEYGNACVDSRPAGAVDVDTCLQPAFLTRIADRRHPSKERIAL